MLISIRSRKPWHRSVSSWCSLSQPSAAERHTPRLTAPAESTLRLRADPAVINAGEHSEARRRCKDATRGARKSREGHRVLCADDRARLAVQLYTIVLDNQARRSLRPDRGERCGRAVFLLPVGLSRACLGKSHRSPFIGKGGKTQQKAPFSVLRSL